jgi:hypothetical protein
MAPPLPARAPARAPPLPARAPPVRISNNQRRPYDQVQHQSYPDSTTHRGAGGYGDYRDVTNHYDEDGEGETVGRFQGEEDQGDGAYEAQEQEQEPEDEPEENHHGGEPVEYNYNAHNYGAYDGTGQVEEEQGYNAHNYGAYDGTGQVEEEQGYNAHNYGAYDGAGQMVEEGEGEDEYDGGYSY